MRTTKQWLSFITLAIIVSTLLLACGATPAPGETPGAQVTEQSSEPTATTDAGVLPETGATIEPGATAIMTDTVEPGATAEPTPAQTTERRGGWLDQITIVEEPSAEAALARIQSGELDMYAYAVSSADVFEQVRNDPNLGYANSYGSLNTLIFNPAGPVFEGTGKLNPFAVARVREAVNWLVDRNYIAEELMGGLGTPRYLPLVTAFPDYARYIEIARGLEREYAYDLERAREIIAEEMEALGAELVGDKWQYNGEPVEIIVLIRTEDERREIGDYVASQLEAVGFTARRDYKTSAEAAPIWNQTEPSEGLFHVYTGGWVNNFVQRDEGGNFDFYYTTRGLPTPLWLAYQPSPEFDEIAGRLFRNDFRSLEEREELYAQALELAMQDSAEVFLVDRISFTPYRQGVVTGYDLAAAVSGSAIWPYTLREEGQEGGSMTLGEPSILTEPWNPIAGTNWLYDAMIQRGVGDLALMPDPFTGLYWPNRIERGELFIEEGLPVTKTLDWVDLQFVPQNQVPEDAFVDWDATAQRFITAAEKNPEGLTARAKLVVHYPEDLFELQWHDGSAFTMADLMMAWILNFDTGKPESALYDEAQVPALETFMTSFRGMRVAQQDPLVVEFYTDQYYLDAEANFWQWNALFFPYYTYGTGAWHNLAIGILSETDQQLAFSTDKADALQVEWMNYIGGPSLQILSDQLDKALADGYIPYEPTLGEYITADEAQARYTNLQQWYQAHGHFWLGTGAYYLDQAFPVEGSVVLRHNAEYPDPADRWAQFGEPRIPRVEIDGPGRVTNNAEATYDVYVDLNDQPYPAADVQQVKYLVYNARGDLAFSGDATPVDDGLWQVTLSAEQTAQLEAGSNRLEAVVVSKVVSLPTFASLVFVTAP